MGSSRKTATYRGSFPGVPKFSQEMLSIYVCLSLLRLCKPCKYFRKNRTVPQLTVYSRNIQPVSNSPPAPPTLSGPSSAVVNIARNSRIGGNGLKIGSSGLAVRGAHHAGPVLDAALALFSLVELIRLVKGFDSRVIGLRVEVAVGTG